MELNVSAPHPIRDASAGWWRGGWCETLASRKGQWGVGTAQAQERECEGTGGWESQGNPRDLPHTTALHEGRSVSMFNVSEHNVSYTVAKCQVFLDNQQLFLCQLTICHCLNISIINTINGSYLKINKIFLRISDLLKKYCCGSYLVFICVRGLCRSLWMICLLQSSAPVDLYLWLLSTFLTCWTGRLCSTVSQTLRPSTSGKPTGSWHATLTLINF